MRRAKLILILAFFLIPVFARAQEDFAKRSISLSWEEIPDSTNYDLELTRVLPDGTKRKPMLFKSKSNEWSGKIPPGTYEMRLRAIDDRNVPGDWSDPSMIPVKLPAASMETAKPAANAQIKANEDVEAMIPFQWAAIPGAKKYKVEVFADDGKAAPAAAPKPAPKEKIEGEEGAEEEERAPAAEAPTEKAEPIATEIFEKTSGSVKLPVAAKYKWRVTGISSEELVGDEPADALPITVIGKKLAVPEVPKPDSKFVTKIGWKGSEYAKKYDYVLTRKDRGGRWQILERKNQTDATEIILDPKKPGGIYKLQVKSYGPLRESSATKVIEFPVYEGLRTPAAIETAMLREAMEKDFDRYFIATYLLSNLDYVGRNKEFGAKADYQALAGTGRLGYGYMPKGKWGMLATLDMGGVIINSKNYTFAAADIQAIWRRYISQATQWRVSGGWFARQIPEARGFTKENVEIQNIGMMGPTLGTQLWHSVTYKLGVQLNLQTNMSMMKMSTPSGGDLVPSLSYQLGLLFSYRLKENMTGFAGVAQRKDSAKYKAKPYTGGSEQNFANAGDVNEVNMTGNYLNLYLEWGF